MARPNIGISILVGVWFIGIIVFICAAGAMNSQKAEECFGVVRVLAYTPDDPIVWRDNRTATNKRILMSDYSVAVSTDIEAWLDGISNNKGMSVPGYNKPGEYSMVNDRSSEPQRTVEVLMTAGDARARALAWGVKQGYLYKQATPAGTIAWIVIDE